MKLLTPQDLRDRGITYSPEHICRLVREGRFPRPVKLGRQDKYGRNHGLASEIDAWLQEKLAAQGRSATVTKPETAGAT
jgi:prophage regulatory protein